MAHLKVFRKDDGAILLIKKIARFYIFQKEDRAVLLIKPSCIHTLSCSEIFLTLMSSERTMALFCSLTPAVAFNIFQKVEGSP